MRGTFILSLDCEGKWGMADTIDPSYDFINQQSLVRVYADLLELLKSHDMLATFAFVGAFTLTEQERSAFADAFEDVQYRGANWLRKFREAQASGHLDGWFCPEAHDMAKAAGHEIGSHGFLHLPFDDAATPDARLFADVGAAVKAARHKGVKLETFVFPRNLVGRVSALTEHGFTGFRGTLRQSRLVSLAKELAVSAAAQPQGVVENGLTVIPPGHFFNWRVGLRKRVPKAATAQRWRSMLQSASRSGGVVHLWLHPHNIISGPETMDVLRDVLASAARMRDAGEIEIVTQAQYARRALKRLTARCGSASHPDWPPAAGPIFRQ